MIFAYVVALNVFLVTGIVLTHLPDYIVLVW